MCSRVRFNKRVLGWGPAAVLLTSLAAGGLLPACASDDGAGVNVNYSATARQNYDKGVVELADENYLEADKYFRFVKSKFPFSKYAVLAELGMSDAKFQRGEYQAAIDSYKAFIRLHPTHEKVEDGYAAFRIAECYVKDMPEDWLILPPAAEKDQSAVRDAARELADFIDKYPESKHAQEAGKQRREVIRRLVEHELYVARFYLDQGHPRAAILRLTGAIEKFPDSEREAELLLTLGETHLEMGNASSAKATFEKVREAYKGEAQARRASVYLDYIRGRFGNEPTDKSPAAPPRDAKAAANG